MSQAVSSVAFLWESHIMGLVSNRTAAARIAGFTFLAYIAAGLTSLGVSRRISGSAGAAARLAGFATHGTAVGVLSLLQLAQAFSAIILGVALYAITRDEDNDLAMFAMVCRIIEGIFAALSVSGTLGLVWLATAAGSTAPDPAFARSMAGYLAVNDVALTATFFAVGSTVFAYLLLRGRMVPSVLAWLGVVASAILVVMLPLQIGGFVRGSMLAWMPMLLFEVGLALWFLVRGVAHSATSRPTDILP